VCGKVISLPLPTSLKKWAWRQGRRGCSDEGEREGQELTSECVLTTPIRNLQVQLFGGEPKKALLSGYLAGVRVH
jgi:hypothetical protein